MANNTLYPATSPYYATGVVNGKFLDVMVDRPILKQQSDIYWEITLVYEYRPDLLASDLFDDPDLWWVFKSRNPEVLDDPVFDFVVADFLVIVSFVLVSSSVSGVHQRYTIWVYSGKVFKSSGTGYTMTLIGLTGGTQDTKNLTFNNAYGDNTSRSQYKTFYFGANTVANGNEGWYINDNTTGFTSTGFYYWQNNYNQFYTPTFLENSDMVLYHYGNNVARVLTATGISQEFSLSAWNQNKNIEVGDSMFMHIYDDGNNYYHVKLYDFEGTLLNTLDTTFTSLDESMAIKDRFVVRFWNNDSQTYVMYMISADSIQSVSLADFNTYDTANDYIWWD